MTKDRQEASIIQQLRGRPVTHEEAAASAQRLVNSHFHNKDSARVSIPANPADDDLIVTDYVNEQATEDKRMRELLDRAYNFICGLSTDPPLNELHDFLAESAIRNKQG